MKTWAMALLVCALGCYGCTGKSTPKTVRKDSGVARTGGDSEKSVDRVWQPLVPPSEFEREREIYRDFEGGLGGAGRLGAE